MNAYKKLQRETLSGRALEKEVFVRITARLANVDTQKPGGVSEKFEALCDNRRLWMVLAADLANDKNECPEEFRAAMLGLAAFVERFTTQVLNNEGDVEVLTDLNRNIIRGLDEATASEAA